MLTLAPIAEDYKDKDTAHFFAKELDSQIRKYFSFLLDKTAGDFQPIYGTATYLSPIHKVFLSPAEVTVAKNYLES